MAKKSRHRVGMTFRMGDVFPATDPVARWLVTLALAVEDLLWANKKFEQAHAEDDPESMDQVHYFRLVSVRLGGREVSSRDVRQMAGGQGVRRGATRRGPRASLSALQATVSDDAEQGGSRVELVKIRDFRAHYLGMHPAGRDAVTRAMKATEDADITVVSSSEIDELRYEHAGDCHRRKPAAPRPVRRRHGTSHRPDEDGWYSGRCVRRVRAPSLVHSAARARVSPGDGTSPDLAGRRVAPLGHVVRASRDRVEEVRRRQILRVQVDVRVRREARRGR